MPKQDITFEVFYDGTWHDLVVDDDVFAAAPIVIRRGQGDESPAPRPAQITAQLANDDDRYRTSNPESPLYGKAGRNTPTRVSVGGVVRGVVEASSWASDQTSDFRRTPRRGKAWTEFEGGGLLQRVGQWTEPLVSAFRQYNDTLDPDHVIGYYPAEQARGSTELVSTIPGSTTPSGPNFGFAFDSQHQPPGSGPLMDISDGAELGYYFNRDRASATSTSGWQLSWAGRYEPLAAGEQTIMYWNTADGTAYGLYLNPTTGEMLIYSSKGGTPVLAYGQSYSGYDFTQWTMFSIDAQNDAGSTDLFVNWTNADNTETGFIGTTFADVTSDLTRWSFLGGAGEVPAGSTVGHIIGVNASSATVDMYGAARIAAWTGHLHERAALRFARLCELKNLPYYVSASWADSTPMGPQPIATLADQFKEIAATDDALIFDHDVEAAIIFLARVDRYNQTPVLNLNPEDLPGLPREVTDDLPIHNLVTVANIDGSEAVAEDATGPLGTQAPPDGAGEYRQTVDVNIDDVRDLPDLANWWLRRGTVNLPRYPKVTVNLAALSPSKILEVEAVDVGSVITITGFREYTIRLHVLGYTEVIGWPNARTITFVCAPDQQFNVGAYEGLLEGWDDLTRRYDSASTTLASATTTGMPTSLALTTANALDVWSTGVPYNIIVSGMELTVTAMGAVTGTGPYLQTATVTPSVNGIVKILPAGAEVHVALQARYALKGD